MSILEKLKINRDKHPEMSTFRIQTIRFKKLLENANALLDLFSDGNEKIQGEYILDRHYVITLIDSVIERLGMIVYDAATLSPENGPDLYRQFDRHKIKAETLISEEKRVRAPNGSVRDDSQKSPVMDPEYLLLSEAISWFHGKGQETVLHLMREAVVSGIREIEKIKDLKNEIFFDEIWIKKTGSRIYLLDLWKDGASKTQEPKSLDAFGSMPLKLLLSDALSDRPSTQHTRKETGEWIILAGEHEISLMSVNSNFNLRLDATASGYEASDYIFVFTDHRLDPEQILPSGFHKEKADSGYFCWKIDVSSDAIKEGLITIGRNIFGHMADHG